MFLSGLGKDRRRLSPHLRSRHAVEHTIAQGPTPVTVLRAGILIGAGSAGWEILRQTVELLPIAVSDPRSRTKHQPIAADDAVGYLVDALDARRLPRRDVRHRRRRRPPLPRHDLAGWRS